MEFQVPEFTAWKVLLTAIGASTIWSRWSRQERLKAVAISALLSHLGAKGRWFIVLEFVLFVGIGVVLAIVIIDPLTARHAFAAGLGWTGLLAQVESKGEQGKA